MTSKRIRTTPVVRAAALAGLMVVAVLVGPAQARQRDTISLTVDHVVPRSIVSGGIRKTNVYNITISGFAREHAKAYLFVDYGGCSLSFAIERGRAVGEGVKYNVTRRFVKTSGWSSTLAQSDHACAYLVNLHTGRVLASASATFLVH